MQCGQTADLSDLRFHWGEAHEITEALGVGRAVRGDNQVSVLATSPGELRDEIIADYTSHPVPRP